MQQTAFNFDYLSGRIGAMSVDTAVAAHQSAIDAIGNAKRSAEQSYRALQYQMPVAQPVDRVIGVSRLESGQKDAIRDLILSKKPFEFGVNYRTWSIRAVRDLIAVEYNIDVSDSLVRNYIKQWGMAAAAPLNRVAAQQRSGLQQDWLVEQYSKIKSKAKAAKQPIIWLSAKQVQGTGGVSTVVHAVSNANRKTSWLALSKENRMGGLSDLIDSLSTGVVGKPLVLFDESIAGDFKAEIQAFLSAKHGSRKDGGGKTKKKPATLVNTSKWLVSIFGHKSEFKPVMVHDDLSVEDDSPEAVADKKKRNERSWWYFQNPNERIANELIEICSKDLVLNPVASPIFKDAFGWMADESQEERSFRWCAKVLGIDPDAYRVGLLIKISQTPMARDPNGKKMAEKRRVALHFIPCYN